MYSSFIKVGNAVFCFKSTMPLELGGNLSQFLTEPESETFSVMVRYAAPGEETTQAHGYAKIIRDGRRFSVALSQRWFPNPSVWLILSMLPLSALLLECGTLILHASCILHKGEAILFSGPSGIGKSSQAALWEQFRGARIINGDRVLVSPGMGSALAGSHYLCGTSGICVNESAPIKAIVLLEQGERNIITRPSPLEIFRLLMAQLDYDAKDRDQMVLVTALVESLLESTKVFRYACRMDESAVADLEKYLL